MTDKEIIKALEYCKEQGITSECSECNIKEKVCRREMIAIALDLINRQQTEIENLKKAYEIYEESSGLKWAKAEAIKKFAERLKSGFGYGWLIGSSVKTRIDNLVKEMTEGNDGTV